MRISRIVVSAVLGVFLIASSASAQSFLPSACSLPPGNRRVVSHTHGPSVDYRLASSDALDPSLYVPISIGEDQTLFESELKPIQACAVVCPGWKADARITMWRLRRRGLDYAITGDDPAGELRNLDVQNVGYGRKPGFHVGLGYVTKTGWEVTVAYSHLETEASASAVKPDPGRLLPTRTHPQIRGYAEAKTADATDQFRFNTFDLEAGRWFTVDRFLTFRLFGGLRWSKTASELSVRYDDEDLDNVLVTNRLDQSGFGVRLGAEGHWNLRCPWTLYGKAAMSLMYGQFDFHYVDADQDAAEVEIDLRDRYTQAVPMLEAEVGISWSRNRWEFRAGYELMSWLEMGDRSMFVDDVVTWAYMPNTTDLLLEGFFLSVTYRH
jgi:hypothetical protein